jgi:hypothetical protein
MRAISEFADAFLYAINVIIVGAGFENDDHGWLPLGGG